MNRMVIGMLPIIGCLGQRSHLWALFISLMGCGPLPIHAGDKPIRAPYNENTVMAPKEQTITEGGIRMEIGKTIRLTPAPISAIHPFLKAVRLKNGDLIFNCPLSGGSHRDYALSPKEDEEACCLRSKDNGETWHKSFSQTTEDGGTTWHVRPTVVQRAVQLTDGTLIADCGRNLCASLPKQAKNIRP